MTRTPETLAHDLLTAATRAGADAADALAVAGTSTSVRVLNGGLEHAERSEGVEIGLRVILGQRQACVSASDTKPETLREMAERAVAMARVAPDDPTIGLADPAQLAQGWDIAALDMCDPSEEPDPAMLEAIALEAEAAALGVAGVAQVQSSSAGYGRHTRHLAATNGFSGGYTRTDHGLSCVAISGEGLSMERDYYGDMRIHRTDLDPAETVGRIAAERAVARAGARQPKTGACPVLFDQRIAGSLIQHILQAVNGAAIARGASWLREALGEQILPKGISLIEDPLRPRASGSRPFDAEGLPTRSRAIIEDGLLTGWTLDLATARKLGLQSTANAARGLSSPPSPSVSNISLTQGTANRDDLTALMGTGLLITSLIGSSINPNTGDYSRGASGFWVEGGQIAYPVNECTVAGNLRDMLCGIVPGNDARLHLSHICPSLLVEGMTLAGA
jgi:PmbA protein